MQYSSGRRRGGTNFAVKVNNVLGREAAKTGRSEKRRRVEMTLGDFLELVRVSWLERAQTCSNDI
jgi:hypothetical protein